LLAPIVLFCFNRPKHLEKTLNALKENILAADSTLYVFSDGPRLNNEKDEALVVEVRNLISNVHGFKNVKHFFSEENKGLANSVIKGISKLFDEYEQVIVLEDDILVSKDFLQFMNDCLMKYKNDESIFSISGYSYKLDKVKSAPELNLVKRASSWGWATWRNVWQNVDWDVKSFESFMHDDVAPNEFMNAGKDQLPMLVKQQKGIINSWAIRWTFHHFLHSGYCLVPKHSKVKNIGTDGSGTNFNNTTNKYETDLNQSKISLIDNVVETIEVAQFIRNYYSPSYLRQIINFMKYRV
jgi:GR25 family glycosyltransferase involved in LPS biosynthesis